MKKRKGRKTMPEYEEGSENVFADLGFENPKDELIKADLTFEIAKIIKKKNLTQAEAAKIVGVDQPRISSLLRGCLDLFSIEALMHFLNALGQDIQIVIKPKSHRRKEGSLSVCFSSNNTRCVLPMAVKER